MVVPERPTDAAAVERRIVSVLFADLVGFTPLSERLDAEDIATIQDAYFATTRETIERYGGVLEKFIGDAAMAVFGIPRGREDDAERAVRAGLALIGAVEQLGARLDLEPGELQLRVGVNSGEVVHATAGPDAGRVTGDTVNTAARLQSAARPGSVLLGELTALSVAAVIETEPSEPIQLKGKAEPVRSAVAIGPRPQPSREEALGELRAPMLGRATEFERLRSVAARTAAARTAGRIVIVAAPGVGKSRLLTELASVAGGIVLRGRVRPQATAPFETVAQLVTSLPDGDLASALVDADVPASRASVIAQEVARLVGTPASEPVVASGDLAAEREARFEAWLTAIDALAPDAETWLVEDVHWAGADLLAFLDHAGRAPSRHGRLIVATARPSLLESDPAWCDTDRLHLPPLPAADAGALIAALLGTSLPDSLVAAIVDRSDGNPLFIEELLRTWASVGILVRDDGRWTLAVEPERVALPPTVQAIYAAQLDDLPADARLLARRGSVAGRRVPTNALDALDVRSTDGLDILRRRDLLTGPLRDTVTGEAYAYRHALLRDAGYASLARAERARLHVAMAGWLESIAGARADTVAEGVAEHYASALDSRPALASDDLPSRSTLASAAAAWYERAAESALRLAAHDAATRLFRRSIELTDAANAVDVGRRRRRLGEVLAASADLDAAIGELTTALAACPDDAPSVAASAYALGRAYMQQIRFGEAERLTADALARLAGEPDALLARLHALHAWTIAAQGRDDGVLDEVERATAMARHGGDPFVELDVLDHGSAARDEIDASSDAGWAELESRARALGAWRHVVTAARARAMYQANDDPAGAVAAYEQTAALAHAHGLVEQAAWCELFRTELLWVVGRWSEALPAGLAVIDLAERNAYERLAFRTYVVVLPLAAEVRDSSVAQRFRAWDAGLADRGPAVQSPYARVLRAAIAAWTSASRGETPEAPPEDALEAVIPMINPHFLAAVESLASAWLATGHRDRARGVADRLAAFAGEADATPLLRASAALVGAWVGRTDPAEAVEAATAAAAPWWTARALRAAGRPGEAEAIEASLGIPGA
ncbi:MAG TPA: adenylate/guanylate cyclase domain-containing protein [Candidatus Limnocylindria bacterium]